MSSMIPFVIVGKPQPYKKWYELSYIVIKNEEIRTMLEVLSLRQELLNQIGSLETVLSRAKGRWTEYLQQIDETDRGKAEELLAEGKRLLEEIIAADRNDALVLQQRKLNLGKAIDQASAARKVNRTYASAAYGRAHSTMDLQQ